MEQSLVRSPIEIEILRTLEREPLWEAWLKVAELIRSTDRPIPGGALNKTVVQTPIDKRNFELSVLWNSVAYPLGSANIPRSEWEDLLIEGIEVFKEFLRSDLEDSWELASYHRLRDRRHLRLEQWRKDPKISKLLIQYQGDD